MCGNCSFFISISAVAVNMVGQIILFRRWRGARYFPTITAGFMAGFVTFVIMEASTLWKEHSADDLVVAVLVNGPIYLALSYCYYSFVQLGQTSIRIRLYSEILSRPDGLGVEEVAREYADESLMSVRLQRLTESGDIVKRGDRYFVGRARLVYIGNILFGAKRFLLGKSSEFE